MSESYSETNLFSCCNKGIIVRINTFREFSIISKNGAAISCFNSDRKGEFKIAR